MSSVCDSNATTTVYCSGAVHLVNLRLMFEQIDMFVMSASRHGLLTDSVFNYLAKLLPSAHEGWREEGG